MRKKSTGNVPCHGARYSRTVQGHRIVAVSIEPTDDEWIDDVVSTLKLSGSSGANRSMVVREALRRLRKELQGKEPWQVLAYFRGAQGHEHVDDMVVVNAEAEGEGGQKIELRLYRDTDGMFRWWLKNGTKETTHEGRSRPDAEAVLRQDSSLKNVRIF